MIVVSDTSPVLNLDVIGGASILPRLYGTLLIPPAVAMELRRNGCDPSGFSWLIRAEAKNTDMIRRLRADLDLGDAEALALALEVGSSRLLIDEHRGRKIATKTGVSVIGLLGILAEAKERNIIGACKPLLDRMIAEAGFWIGDLLYAQYLTRMNE